MNQDAQNDPDGNFPSLQDLQPFFRPNTDLSCICRMPDSLRSGAGRDWNIKDVTTTAGLQRSFIVDNIFWPPAPGEAPIVMRQVTYQEFLDRPTTSVWFEILGCYCHYVPATSEDIVFHHNLIWAEGPNCPLVQTYCEVDMDQEELYD